MCIICLEHGEFWQTPHSHLSGQGCPICNESHLEEKINNFLLENNIQFERQKRFEWLDRQSLDFYLPQYNIAIECQGIQHFKPVDFFGGEEHFNYVKKLDELKLQLCNEHNIKILYYTNTKLQIKQNNLFYDINEIINEKKFY